MKKFFIDSIESELGQLLLVSDGASICAFDFAEFESRLRTGLKKRFDAIHFVEKNNPQGFVDEVQAYFQGHLDAVTTLPVNPGGTAFQQQVWLTLRTIPPGAVITYAELARRVGKPTAYRAVGMANGQNPIVIVLPCHRVIGSNAKLTGYAGGLDRKRWLLHHEGITGM